MAVVEGSAAPPPEAATTPKPRLSPARAEAQVETQLWRVLGDDLALMKDVAPPPRFAHARERLLMLRLYVGLIRTLSDDYGAPFAALNDSATFRAIGIYVFFRTILCAPVQAGDIAHALRLPRATVVRRLQELIKHGFVERVGNAYRVTEKVNIPDLDDGIERRIAMIADTARQLAELRRSSRPEPGDAPAAGEP